MSGVRPTWRYGLPYGTIQSFVKAVGITLGMFAFIIGLWLAVIMVAGSRTN